MDDLTTCVLITVAAFTKLSKIVKYEDRLQAGRYLLIINGSVEDLKSADFILSDMEYAGLHLNTELRQVTIEIMIEAAPKRR